MPPFPGKPFGPQLIGASLVPAGFAPHVKENYTASKFKEWTAEWNWEFIRMEHFLLKSFNHPQMRFFLFIMLMYQTHLKESTSLDPAFLR